MSFFLMMRGVSTPKTTSDLWNLNGSLSVQDNIVVVSKVVIPPWDLIGPLAVQNNTAVVSKVI